MKKTVFLLVLVLTVATFLESCSSAPGLSASRQRRDLKVKGLSTVSGFDPSKKVLAADSLYLSPGAAEGKARPMRQIRRDYILTNGLNKFPLYLYQSADSGGVKWGVKIVNEGGELKIESPIEDYDAVTSKAGGKTSKVANYRQGRATTGAATVDVYGSIVKAVPTGNSSIAGYTPILVSFFLNVEEPMRFVHYSYNNVDSKVYDLDDPTQFQSLGDKVYSREINLRYGDKFGLQAMDGRLINLSPEAGLKLEGVVLTNSLNGNYLFQISGADDLGADSRPTTSKNYPLGSKAADVDYKTMVDGNTPFKRARNANLSKYTNGYLVVPVSGIACRDYDLFNEFVRSGVIGTTAEGFVQKNVIVSPEYLKSRSPRVYEKFKHTLRYPATGSGSQRLLGPVLKNKLDSEYHWYDDE